MAAIRTELAAVMLHALLPVGLDVRGLDVKPELVDQRVAFGAGAAAQKLRARARERREREPERKAVGCRRERGETAQYGVRLRRRRTAVAFLLAQRLTLADPRLQAGRAAGGARVGEREAADLVESARSGVAASAVAMMREVGEESVMTPAWRRLVEAAVGRCPLGDTVCRLPV